MLSPTQASELITYRQNLNPRKIATEIAAAQDRLRALAKTKTDQLYLASFPTALPHIRKGIRVKAS